MKKLKPKGNLPVSPYSIAKAGGVRVFITDILG